MGKDKQVKIIGITSGGSLTVGILCDCENIFFVRMSDKYYGTRAIKCLQCSREDILMQNYEEVRLWSQK